MNAQHSTQVFSDYVVRLQGVLANADWSNVALLAADIQSCWENKRRLFLCGNGGSAGNAIHLANDFLYGVAKKHGGGVDVHALTANAAVLTCLGNDLGYENIFSEQLAVQGRSGDILIVLSGSGNSPNIVKVLEQARESGVKSYALLGFDGGKSKTLADIAIHFAINDMQIAEDLQLIVGHMLMQHLQSHQPHRSDA